MRDLKTVYTKDNCPACVTLKELLNTSKVPFQEVKIGRDISREDFMKKYPSVRSVPYMVEAEDAS